MAQTLEQAIISVFAGRNVAEANKFIIEFSETEAAWEAATGLCNSSHDYVQYFAANILYTKVNLSSIYQC